MVIDLLEVSGYEIRARITEQTSKFTCDVAAMLKIIQANMWHWVF
jgi:hypothetical protein